LSSKTVINFINIIVSQRSLLSKKKVINFINIIVSYNLYEIAGRLGSKTKQTGKILINGRKQALAYGASVRIFC